MRATRRERYTLRHVDEGMNTKVLDQRGRIWLIGALSVVSPIFLAAGGETLCYDTYLETITTKRPTHSSLRQSAVLYELISNLIEYMPRPSNEPFADVWPALRFSNR